MTGKKRSIIAVMDDSRSVASALEAQDAICLDINRWDEIKRAIPHVDGVVLTGGGDIQCQKYGETNEHDRAYGYNQLRDRREHWAVTEARKRRIPVMGICRGHQMLNVAYGGSLHQHLPELEASIQHTGSHHSVLIRPNSQIGSFMETDNIPDVTSLHHQAVDRLGDGLVPVGWAEDGTIEMIESAPGLKPYVLGCQFHPEMDWIHSDEALFIFMYFMRHVVSHASGKGRVFKRLDSVKDLVFGNKTQAWHKGSGYRSGPESSWPPSETNGWRKHHSGVGWTRDSSQQYLDDSPDVVIIKKDDDEADEGEHARLETWLEDHNKDDDIVCTVDVPDLPSDVTIDGRRVPFWMQSEDVKELDDACHKSPCASVEDCFMWGDCAAAAIIQTSQRNTSIVQVSDVTVKKGKRGNPRKKKGGSK